MAPRRDELRPGPGDIWGPALRAIPTDALVRAIAGAVRALLPPEYAANRPSDRRPQRAIEAAEAWLVRRTEDARHHAKAVAKACTNARADTLGHQHRIAEAARAVATSVIRREETATRADLYEALAKVEEHLVYRSSVAGTDEKETEVRARILQAVTRDLRV